MMKRKTKRLAAVLLTVILGMTSVTGYGSFIGKGIAVSEAAGADNVSYVFEEGYGTGNSFNEAHWIFGGQYLNDANQETPLDASHKSAIVDDTEYLNQGKVIRLIRGVKASESNNYLEDSSSYDTYRTGRASLNAGDITLNENADFFVKFTFSMPEAVVNTTQTGEERYAREVGGDGIAFVMTSQAGQEAHAGSGIGYQGMDDSIAIEMDSFFNGIYYYPTKPDNNYENWNFSNQLYLHNGENDGINSYGGNISAEYGNYENPGHNERFDHIALTVNGDARNHQAICYINHLDPTKLMNNQYVNLANRYNSDGNIRNTGSVGTEQDRSSSTCATRFADASVNNRLFTVWVEYDGSTKKMKISYANGNYKDAVKPDAPQIDESIDLADKFGGKQIYMGFTSAVASSKANHTIHSFYFSNNLEASYKLNYYLKQADGSYALDKTSDPVTGAVGITAKAEDINSNYKNEYSSSNYVYSTTHEQKESVKLEEAGKTYEMNVYYDPAPAQQAKYKLNYHKWNPATGEYELVESTDEKVGDVGNTYEVTDVDPAYENKYNGYTVNTAKDETYTVTLDEANKTYEMNVYYDPEPVQQAKYKLNYHKWNPATGEYELVESTNEKVGDVGNTYEVTDVDPAYENKYNGYTVNTAKDETYTVTLGEANKTYEMNVYYDPAPAQQAKYKLNYHKWNPATGEYELVESTDEKVGDVGNTYEVTDVDPAYENKYNGYTVNTAKDETYTVTLGEANKTYEMNVYYDPAPAQQAKYKLNYYKLDPDTGEYKLVNSTDEKVGEVGNTYEVTNVDPAYVNRYSGDGYTVNTAKDDAYTVTLDEADKIYEMKVYYDPQKTTYKTEHYLKQEDGSYKLKDTVPGEETYVGKSVSAVEKEYPGYTHVKTGDSVENATVAPDGSTTLKVYYDPESKTPAYRLNYHKLNPNTGEYEYITSTGTIVGNQGDTKSITDADPDYEDKYHSDGYTVNSTKNEDWSVKLTEADQIYDMNVYYDPKKVSYKTNYYLKQPDGTYKLQESVTGPETYAGKNVNAEIKIYDGYQHVDIPDTLETATVNADGTTTLKVYYDPEPKPTYKVQYYVEQPDGTYKLYEERKDLPGTAGETVTAQIITINGYVHTTTPDTLETATVNADGTTILKVYYNMERVVQPTTEPTTQPTTEPEEEDTEEEEEKTPTKKANKPKTGDETNIAFLLIVASAAGAVGGICLYFRKKEDE